MSIGRENLNVENQTIEDFFTGQNPKSVLADCLREMAETPVQNTISKCFCVFSALDIMAQMYAGKAGTKRTAKKTILFYRKYMQLNEITAEVLYQLRNAVTHSFGTHSSNPAKKTQYRFVYNLSGDKLFEQKSAVVYSVNTDQLNNRFLRAVQQFKTDVLNDAAVRKRFFAVYRRIGTKL